MKEIYSKPIAEIEKFKVIDVLTASGDQPIEPTTDWNTEPGQGGMI